MKLLKLKSVPVEKGQRGGDRLAGLVIWGRKGKEPWKSLGFVHSEREREWREEKPGGQEELLEKEGWDLPAPYLFFSVQP